MIPPPVGGGVRQLWTPVRRPVEPGDRWHLARLNQAASGSPRQVGG